MAAPTDTENYLDPRVLAKVQKLELRARLVVEGFISGMHKSPYQGFSVEFAQHREYVPGDDIRFVDWKIYGEDRPLLHQGVRGRDQPARPSVRRPERVDGATRTTTG